MSVFCDIPRNEMEQFLTPQGFRLIALPGVRELVFGKRVDRPGRQLTLRIYTSIDPDGVCRSVGTDAIRATLFEKGTDGQVHMVGGSRRVHRVQGWRHNLQTRINRWQSLLGPECPKCNALMVFKKTPKGIFWACSRFPDCRSTLSVKRSRDA
jgi:hypothetical protein